MNPDSLHEVVKLVLSQQKRINQPSAHRRAHYHKIAVNRHTHINVVQIVQF